MLISLKNFDSWHGAKPECSWECRSSIEGSLIASASWQSNVISRQSNAWLHVKSTEAQSLNRSVGFHGLLVKCLILINSLMLDGRWRGLLVPQGWDSSCCYRCQIWVTCSVPEEWGQRVQGPLLLVGLKKFESIQWWTFREVGLPSASWDIEEPADDVTQVHNRLCAL